MSLPDILIAPPVRAALLEDLGRRGDVTAMATVPENRQARAVLRARQNGRIAGLDTASCAFRLLDPQIRFNILCADGSDVIPGDDIATIEGSARALLSAERTALNFLCHLSGIASATQILVKAIGAHPAKLCCTRKTTPGLRALEKYAVSIGGGVNHRYGLDDAILIKDNHIALAGGIAEAVSAARAQGGHMLKIEVEVDTLAQLDQLLSLPAGCADAVLLDNMNPAQLKEAVARVAGKLTTEASGRINAENIAVIAASGVDLISSGWITHSAPILDIGLDIDA